MKKFKKTIATLCLSLIVISSSGAVVNAESVYQGKIGGNDVWHVTGYYHIKEETNWINFENRILNGGRLYVAGQIALAAMANNLGRGYLKVIRHPDNRWTYEAVTWL